MNKYMIVGAAAAGLALVFIVYKGAGKAVALVGDAAQAVNPLNNHNIINQAATGGYQWLTGSDGTIGTDLQEAISGGALDPTSTNNVAYGLANSGWRAIGVLDKDDTIGTKLYDGADALETWFKGLW